jgi:hypothetical protein
LAGLKYTTSCEKPLLHYVNIAAAFSTKDGSSEADMKENKDQLDKDVRIEWIKSIFIYSYFIRVILIGKCIRRMTWFLLKQQNKKLNVLTIGTLHMVK